jgi:periplasmic protein TonB
LSSAEDKTSSTVLPSQGSSNSTSEKSPVDARQEHAPEHANEDSSSTRSSGDPLQIDLKAEALPAQPAEEPGDDAGIPLKTKPFPKVNAVAREIPVKVTGTRVGSAFIERELFTESTTTVLVFEKGGVIRLTAAVTPRQLLFLTNEESKREAVAQVMRKRDYRPMECYVEFEFSEPAPGFWGMESSAATPLLPKDAKEIAAVELVASAETTEDELDDVVPPHSAEEVEALKREVEALRSQLNLLQTHAEPPQVAPTVTTSNPPSMQPVDTPPPQAPKEEMLTYQSERAPWTELSADVAATESEPKPSRVYAPDEDLQLKPALDFHVPVPKLGRSFRARGQFTPGFRSGMLRLAILSGVLAGLIGLAWYKRWLPWMHESTKFSVSTFAGGVTTKVATPKPVALPTEASKGNAAINEPLSAKAVTPGTGSSSETPSDVAAGNEREFGSSAYEVVKSATREKSKPTASISKARPSPVVPVPTKMVNPVPTLTGNSGFVPPKLIKSERAVASLDDLRDFETGSVVIDAFIDTDGSVGSMTVLSGPPSLRQPALRAIKDYKYEPATQNGHPIAAHVTVKIQFHFE